MTSRFIFIKRSRDKRIYAGKKLRSPFHCFGLVRKPQRTNTINKRVSGISGFASKIIKPQSDINTRSRPEPAQRTLLAWQIDLSVTGEAAKVPRRANSQLVDLNRRAWAQCFTVTADAPHPSLDVALQDQLRDNLSRKVSRNHVLLGLV